MKKEANYRKIYKEHYGINFSADYEVHHIDFDRENNNIGNLILLPKKLHHKYHFFLDGSMNHSTGKPFERIFDARIGGNLAESTAYSRDMLKHFSEVLDECAKWYDYKLYLDGLADNVHGITLEGGKK